MINRDPLQFQAAAAAAELICAQGRNFSRARRDIRERIGLMPSTEAVQSQMRRWYALFDPNNHRQSLNRQRSAALTVMQALSDWRPQLFGAVLNGSATAEANIEIYLRTDDAKSVELKLLSMGIDYESQSDDTQRLTCLMTECDDLPIVLYIGKDPLERPAIAPDPWQTPLEANGKIKAEQLRLLLNQAS